MSELSEEEREEMESLSQYKKQREEWSRQYQETLGTVLDEDILSICKNLSYGSVDFNHPILIQIARSLKQLVKLQKKNQS